MRDGQPLCNTESSVLGDSVRQAADHGGESCSAGGDDEARAFDAVLCPKREQVLGCVNVRHHVHVQDASPVVVRRVDASVDQNARVAHVNVHLAERGPARVDHAPDF
mmetsp:Transcript_17290/g.23818  ORF Transcript_17290/g.23818 Transcript_17290/m.23818 type:complete len:107 (+) Transcript_17290:382-702(+)